MATGSFFLGQQQVFPALVARITCALGARPAATGAADSLNDSSSLHRRIQENVAATFRACLLVTDLGLMILFSAFEHLPIDWGFLACM
jgi:hypothetical protein